MDNNNRTNYKRQYREMEQSVKDKIRMSMTGHRHSDETKRKISDGQKLAWSRIPYRNQDDRRAYTDNN